MRALRALPLALLVLAGCGGGGDTNVSNIEGNSGTLSIAFAGDTDYNGETGTFAASSSFTGSVLGNTANIEVVNGNRGLDVSLSGATLQAGRVIDLSGTTGSTVTYTEDGDTFAATSGTVTVLFRSLNGFSVRLDNVVVDAAGGGAAGSATLSGTVTLNGN